MLVASLSVGLGNAKILFYLTNPIFLLFQVNKEKYKNTFTGFKLTYAEGGPKGMVLGWAPTAIGYSAQGLCKFGFYEVFKNLYSGMMGEENAYLYRTSLYLAASASAEFFTDIALSPMESVKVSCVLQGDSSGWSLGSVDIKAKVPF